jgi:hypothetical protein
VRRKFWKGHLNERDNLGDVGVNGRILLECILGK